MIKRFLLGLLVACGIASGALAQTSPGFVPGQPLPASQLNAAFASKQDYVPQATTANLATFAKAAGVTLCTGDGVSDQKAFNAAYTAMAAAASGNGLYVFLPPCLNPGYQVTGILIANRGGYYATPQSVMINQVRASASSAPTNTITLDNGLDTNWLISGLILNGGWSYGRSPYGSNPETDPWLDQEIAININNSFSGNYAPNNPTGQGSPNGRILNTSVSNYAGTCYAIHGPGVAMYRGLSAFTCGGYGILMDQFDSKLDTIDIGNTGRSGVELTGAGSDDQASGKIWFSGFRKIFGDQSGVLALEFSKDFLWDGEIQDPYCDAILDAGTTNSFRGTINWVGQNNGNLCSGLAIYKTAGGVISPRVDLTINSDSNAYPKITYLINDAANFVTKGNFTFTETGMPAGMSGPVNTGWFTGTLDFSNLITVDGSLRAPRSWFPGPNFNNTSTIINFGVTDSVTNGPIGLNFTASSNFMYLTVGTGGFCVQSSQFSSPCTIHVDSSGVGTYNITGLGDVALGTAAASPTGTSGATVPLLSTANTWSLAQSFSNPSISVGTPPVLTGTCTSSTVTGGASAGSFTTSCTSQTVIITFLQTAPHGYACTALDETTPTDLLTQTAHSATTCTLTGTTAASDAIVFTAAAF